MADYSRREASRAAMIPALESADFQPQRPEPPQCWCGARATRGVYLKPGACYYCGEQLLEGELI